MRGERLHSDHPEALANGTAENDMYLIAMSVCCDLEGSVHYKCQSCLLQNWKISSETTINYKELLLFLYSIIFRSCIA